MGFITLNNGIEYDEKTHKYRYNGIILDSVTYVLNHASPIPDFLLNDEKFQLLTKAGSEIHAATEHSDAGNILDSEFMSGLYTDHDNIIRNVDKWRRWRDNNVADIINIEFGIVSAKHLFCGRIDRMVKMLDGSIVVIDIKSGSATTNGRLQVAAYILALKEMGFHIDYGCVVSLKGDSAKPSFINMIKHQEMFLGRLEQFRKDKAVEAYYE